MISFSSFPEPVHDIDLHYGGAMRQPTSEDDIDMAVELEEEDFDNGHIRLALPGDPLTSAQAFMR